MAQWKFQYTQKEVYILSRPSKLQPVADYSIVTQYTHREKDQDLPQLHLRSSRDASVHTPGASYSRKPSSHYIMQKKG